MSVNNHSKLVLIGATGLVGTQIVRQFNDGDSSAFEQLHCLVRRPVPNHSPQVSFQVIDFEDLHAVKASLQGAGLIITLGTTIAKAGSREAFREVDYELVVSAASLALDQGVQTAAVVSSLGADPNNSNFYLRTKGEMEEALKSMGFESLTIVRPALLSGDREEYRLGERLGLVAGKLLQPIIPKKYRPVAASDVARCLLDALHAAQPGIQIIESDQIRRS